MDLKMSHNSINPLTDVCGHIAGVNGACMLAKPSTEERETGVA